MATDVCVCECVCVYVSAGVCVCWMLLSNQNFELKKTQSGMGGGGNGCGSGLLGLTSNNKLHSPDGTAFTLRAHAAPSGECNYCVCVCV